MDKPVYVIGHRPGRRLDLCGDQLTPALKNKLGMNTLAARLSAVNKETLYILERFRCPCRRC